MGRSEITRLLARWQAGDAEATDQLVALVYPDLRRLAASRLADDDSVFLQATELVHEAYLRLAGQRRGWLSREQFFAIAARVMRRIVIDQSRLRSRAKRGGGMARVTLRTDCLGGTIEEIDLVALNAALEELATIDGDALRIVEMRFFAGLTMDEIARSMNASPSTVARRWRFARAWLEHRLSA